MSAGPNRTGLKPSEVRIGTAVVKEPNCWMRVAVGFYPDGSIIYETYDLKAGACMSWGPGVCSPEFFLRWATRVATKSEANQYGRSK